ncbi:SUMF1/EgtB/PvdO family nonheme iron enzyme [Aquimarina sp. MMG016]|uniref:formylglycine-generating enzyme family protein n=1 Tax=Aquimarina sp. MMG016 TaxID=2822690 RepID=UPI001B3A37D3|nr:SUMF1/EgtB/PvdO family nonheme iron enzyme [Aquimarina sp. MMG016]MBQ4820264.1 SUMF1/EgtB/PvdO family nonheme iron enzyme [Aquimarina sp. MMG016]
MKNVSLLLILILLLNTKTLFASDLTISNVRAIDRGDVLATPVSVIFDIRWKNAWNNKKNHDAVWVFMKFNGYWDTHVKLLPNGHRILKNRSGESSSPTIKVSNDSLGFFIYPSKTYRGDVNYKVQVLMDTTHQKIDRNKLRGLSVHGLEMVYIPQGSFTIGSPDKAAIKRAALYKSDANGEPKGLVTISSEKALTVGPEDNALYYWSKEAKYNGDQKGPIPDEFPKGYNAFYIMKYEVTQGQYTDFLNTLPDGWTYQRAPIGGRDYYKKRGGIRCIDGKYIADTPTRPMNYISFTDGLAYSDWAALRPITELEYEKAARGPSKPIDAEFVWGTNTYDDLERYVNPDAELAFSNTYDESKLTDATRPIYGASYYWVMDLSGSLWEKVITIGNPIGRAFKGSHGDGKLDFGNATNDDWPKSDHEIGGFGYRGGGYYQIGTGYSDFNPHSPIGYRYYGAWSGGPRYIAYGYRAGRSAEKK